MYALFVQVVGLGWPTCYACAYIYIAHGGCQTLIEQLVRFILQSDIEQRQQL